MTKDQERGQKLENVRERGRSRRMLHLSTVVVSATLINISISSCAVFESAYQEAVSTWFLIFTHNMYIELSSIAEAYCVRKITNDWGSLSSRFKVISLSQFLNVTNHWRALSSQSHELYMRSTWRHHGRLKAYNGFDTMCFCNEYIVLNRFLQLTDCM